MFLFRLEEFKVIAGEKEYQNYQEIKGSVKKMFS